MLNLQENLLNKIIHGNCLEMMKNIPDKSIDMILCDLPYGITARNKWDVILPFDKLWEQYRRITKENSAIVLNGQGLFSAKLIMSNPKWYKYTLIWEKNKVRGFLNAKRQPLRIHEDILVFYNKQCTYNPQKTTGHKPVNSFCKISDGMNYGKTKAGFVGGGQTDRYPVSIIKIPVVNNDLEVRFHPTEKPVALCEYLIKTYSNVRDTILDNCCGSGSTLVACKNLGRNYIGIELEENYCKISEERLK